MRFSPARCLAGHGPDATRGGAITRSTDAIVALFEQAGIDTVFGFPCAAPPVLV